MSLPNEPFLQLQANGSVLVMLHVSPNAPRTTANGMHDNALSVRLKAAPVDGKANAALVLWLAGQLGVARRDIAVLRGPHSRRKQLCVAATAVSTAQWTRLLDQG